MGTRLLLETHWLENIIPAVMLTYFISVSLPAVESGRISQVRPDSFHWNPRGNCQKHECVCDCMRVCVCGRDGVQDIQVMPTPVDFL